MPREMKFLVPREMAIKVKEWAQRKMRPDPYAVQEWDNAYRVRSLYLDTPELDVFHRRSSYGRGKYRIRQYLPSGITFLERKLKSNGVVRKRRTQTEADNLTVLGQGGESNWPGSWYQRRLALRRLQPVCQITYLRFPFMERVDSGTLRLTIDSEIRAVPAEEYYFRDSANGAEILPEHNVVELKYFGETPALFNEIVSQFGLNSQGVSKYRKAVSALGIEKEKNGSETAPALIHVDKLVGVEQRAG
jgi:hypothetical protein